jgi:succinyl-CoA synthetase beta subunit
MLTREMEEILSASKKLGWVLEPQAKRLFSLAGMDVPRYVWVRRIEDAVPFAEEIGYPVVAKIVSPEVVHKSEHNGVAVGIKDGRELKETFKRFSQLEGFSGVLVEEMISGIELIIGAKVDFQFGPVVLFGIGGIWVEIYRDVVLRMAPLQEKDVVSMVRCLKGRRILEGYRGASPVNFQELKRLLVTFSNLVMDLEKYMESIDLNPVICTSNRCVVADARIMLRKRAM